MSHVRKKFGNSAADSAPDSENQVSTPDQYPAAHASRLTIAKQGRKQYQNRYDGL